MFIIKPRIYLGWGCGVGDLDWGLMLTVRRGIDVGDRGNYNITNLALYIQQLIKNNRSHFLLKVLAYLISQNCKMYENINAYISQIFDSHISHIFYSSIY